jgi:hypothetical protein
MSGPTLVDSEETLSALGGETIGMQIPVNGLNATLALSLTIHEDEFCPPLSIIGKLRLREYAVAERLVEFPKAPRRDNVVPDRRN